MKTTVLITGATAGIGRFLAIDLARRGLRVFATGRDEAALSALRAEEPLVETIRLDVCDGPSIASAKARVDELTQGHGLDVLVNNAGYGLPGAIEELPLEAVRHEFETNVFGLLAVTQAFLPAMRARRAGRIVNMGSVAGRVTFPLYGAYHMSKYAVEALSDALRAEVARDGVKVVIIEPGPIRSDFSARQSREFDKVKKPGSPYESAYEAAIAYKKAKNAHAPGPECVAKAVRHAVLATRPKTRYVMPVTSRVLAKFSPLIPTWLWDRLVRKRAGLLAVLFAALVGVAAARAEDPPKPLAQRIREATLRAAKALAANPPKRASMKDARALVALALLRAGGPEERRAARGLLDDWWRDANGTWVTPTGNYELSLFIQALEGCSLVRIDDPSATQEKPRFLARAVPAADKEKLEKATSTLLASAVKTASGTGIAWRYGCCALAEGTRSGGLLTNNGKDESYFDNSNTQFSVLALHEAVRAGVALPADVPEKIGRHFLWCAHAEPSLTKKAATGSGALLSAMPLRWGYLQADKRESMYFAGLSSLAIARELGWKNADLDEAIRRGLLELAPWVRRGKRGLLNGEGGWGDSYQLYSIEKALDLLAISDFDGKAWFPPLAEEVLSEQGADGLWNGDAVDTSFYVIFLTRGTLSSDRLVTTSSGSKEEGAFVSPKTKKTVNAVELVRDFAKATGKEVAKARAAADEAVSLLAAEGHGAECCLLAPLAELAGEKGAPGEAAARWAREIAGESVSKERLQAAASSWERLHEGCDLGALRAALGKTSLLPVRAFAAVELAAVNDRNGVAALADACDALADEKLLATPAGARCARAFADALTAVLVTSLPELPAKGSPSAAQLKAVAKAARAKK